MKVCIECGELYDSGIPGNYCHWECRAKYIERRDGGIEKETKEALEQDYMVNMASLIADNVEKDIKIDELKDDLGVIRMCLISLIEYEVSQAEESDYYNSSDYGRGFVDGLYRGRKVIIEFNGG